MEQALMDALCAGAPSPEIPAEEKTAAENGEAQGGVVAPPNTQKEANI